MASVMGKNCFLSGPMSEYEHYNVGAFIDAHVLLKELGAKEVYDPAVAWLQSEAEHTHEEWMALCITELTHWPWGDDKCFYDVLVQLPGWDKSKGARTERTVAEACGMEVIELEDIDD